MFVSITKKHFLMHLVEDTGFAFGSRSVLFLAHLLSNSSFTTVVAK